MTCAELQERSLALVTLPDGDSERLDAEQHALSCPACASALAEARAMLRLLDRHGDAAPPSPEVLRRTHARVAAEIRGGEAGLPWRSGLALGLTLAASALFAALVGGPGEIDPRLGVKCTLIELFAASLPLAATVCLMRRRGAWAGPLLFGCVAAAGALGGQAFLHLTCERHVDLPHLFAFHVAGVALAALVGALVSLPFRPRPG